MIKKAKRCIYFGIAVTLMMVYTISFNGTRYMWTLNDNTQNIRMTIRKQVIRQEVPVIYLVTPTAARLEQSADLTRLSHTLRLVPNIHWIIVEDNQNKTRRVANILAMSNLSYTHLNVTTPEGLKTRGMAQRNAGIDWIRQNVKGPGVVYFADDDNTYDLRLFEEMRTTKRVSVWPVGLVALLKYEAPICKDGKVTGWYTTYNRKFATDMAGFAINVDLFRNRTDAKFTNAVGLMETDLLNRLKINMTDLEPKANNCTQILVWHTRTQKSNTQNEKKLREKFANETIHLDV